MPEDNSKKKESKRGNKPQEKKISIKVELGQEQVAQEALRDQKQAKPNEEELKGKEEGKSSGGLLKGIVNFIKGIFSATIDMPQEGQFGSSEMQGQWLSLKDPKDLDEEKVKEAAEGLKEGLKRSDASNKSIDIEAPDQTPAQDVENSKTIER